LSLVLFAKNYFNFKTTIYTRIWNLYVFAKNYFNFKTGTYTRVILWTFAKNDFNFLYKKIE
jgi:hypothetical protein